MSLTDALREQADADKAVVIIEPPSGLTDEQRAAIQEAISLMAAGRMVEANAILGDYGFAFTAHRVSGGKLVDL